MQVLTDQSVKVHIQLQRHDTYNIRQATGQVVSLRASVDIERSYSKHDTPDDLYSERFKSRTRNIGAQVFTRNSR